MYALLRSLDDDARTRNKLITIDVIRAAYPIEDNPLFADLVKNKQKAEARNVCPIGDNPLFADLVKNKQTKRESLSQKANDRNAEHSTGISYPKHQ